MVGLLEVSVLIALALEEVETRRDAGIWVDVIYVTVFGDGSLEKRDQVRPGRDVRFDVGEVWVLDRCIVKVATNDLCSKFEKKLCCCQTES